MANDKPLVSVIILNYNGLKFLPACLDSLRRTRYQPIEIIVADNNSSDDSIQLVRDQYPDVKILSYGENLGYSGAYNKATAEIESKYLVLLNFDVEVEPDWLTQGIELLESEPKLAATQPKLKAYQNHSKFEYSGGSGGFLDAYGYPFVRGRIFDHVEADENQYNDVVPIQWATGAALIVRREAYLDAGGLDSDFFMHMEELDLCWRFWLRGWKIKVAPEGTVYHWAGAALSADRFHKMYYNHRNSLVMLIKNYSLFNLIKRLPIRILLDWITILTSPLRGEYKRTFAVLAAHGYVLTRFFKVLQKRSKVQKNRIVQDNDLNHVVLPFSIVWRYYLKNRRTFSEVIAR